MRFLREVLVQLVAGLIVHAVVVLFQPSPAQFPQPRPIQIERTVQNSRVDVSVDIPITININLHKEENHYHVSKTEQCGVVKKEKKRNKKQR